MTETIKACLYCATMTWQGDKCSVCGRTEEEMKKKEHEEALDPGTILKERYQVARVLGCGGFGITYAGFDFQEMRRIAIKECFLFHACSREEKGKEVVVKSSENAKAFDDAKNRFLEEANLIKENSDNPGIIQIYDVFNAHNTVYYVMEYLDGCDLKTYLKEKGGVLTWSETATLLEPVFTSLISLHRFNIWHRDISPDNIFVCKNNEVRLIDFGSARLGRYGKSRILDVAKAGYAPIEQCDDCWEQGTWTDVYAMAATVYRCITGVIVPPAVQRIRRDEYVAPSKYADGVPEFVEDALKTGLAVLPQNRYQTMAEIKYALFRDKQTIPLEDRIVEDYPEASESMEEIVCRPRLLGLDGLYRNQEIAITGVMTLGRREDVCNVPFPEFTPGVSGMHCTVRWNEEKRIFILKDLNSTYGTRNLGGKMYEKGKDIYLNEGEGFIVGDDNIFTFVY